MTKSQSPPLLITLLTALAMLCAVNPVSPAANPKREFRGAWMHTVFQDQYKSQTTQENKAYIRQQLDALKAAGVNAVFFQVRPQADAFYDSRIEPWSMFLTSAGKAPSPYWDPLEFIIGEAHSRGMELHAWLNPYRVTSSAKQQPPPGHIYHKHPGRFIRFDGKIYFDPGQPENIEHIRAVISDIVTRYDVDGVHFDDYFYPYPKKGVAFDDQKSYARYGSGMKLGDWRRSNVDRMIQLVSGDIRRLKPWVRFGISPFGIWRNKSSHPAGSDTNGLENYDSLYADVLLWAKNGWIDYLMPQLYWELDNPRASYTVLNQWWNDNANNRHVYIGQSIERTMKYPASDNDATQLKVKIAMTREADNIQGNCWWPAYSLTDNFCGIADSLATTHQSTIALPPSYPWLSDVRPEPPFDLCVSDGKLWWSAPAPTGDTADCIRFAVYRFDHYDDIDIDNPANIVAVTYDNHLDLYGKGVYVVTSLDRVNNESLPSRAFTVN